MSKDELTEQASMERPPLFVHQGGTGNTPCVLIHGYADGAYVWVDLLRNLPADYRAFAVDLRGHGYSPRSADGQYLTHQHVGDVIETLDLLGFDRLVVIGHSMGGDVAIRVALAQPHRVAALVIVDFGLESSPAGKLVMKNLWHSLRVYATTDEYLQSLTRTRPLVCLELLKYCAAEALEGSVETGFKLRLDPRFFSSVNDPRQNVRVQWETLARIACPTLLLRGASSSVLSRAVASRMAASIPNCTLREIKGAGHTPMLENPCEFRQEVSQFLSEVRDRMRPGLDQSTLAS